MFIRSRFPYLAPEGGAGGAAAGGDPAGGNAGELVEVDLGSGKVKLPAADAQRVIGWRDAEKKAKREAEERAGRLQAEKDAAEAARLKAEDERKALEHAKAGELDKTRELLTKDHQAKLDKVARNLRDRSLEAAVRGAAKVVPAAVPDIIDQLRARSRYDLDADAVVVLDEAGQPLKDDAGAPVKVDAFLSTWLAKRPHYVLDGTPAGSGAAGGSKGTGATRTITRAQYEQAREANDFATLNGVAKGQIRLTD
jgi:hypothetical protein